MKQILAFSRARKSFEGRVVLGDVTLAFFPGAKIGVVGPNGAGKSTLLKMMACPEQPSNGDARLFPGFTVRLLSQEPQLDESKNVLENVQEGGGRDQLRGHSGQWRPAARGKTLRSPAPRRDPSD